MSCRNSFKKAQKESKTVGKDLEHPKLIYIVTSFSATKTLRQFKKDGDTQTNKVT